MKDDNGHKKQSDVEEIVQEEQVEEEKTEDYKEKYLRALADYQNLERQTQSWKDDFVQYANVGLVRKLLEILDDLEKAQEHIEDEGLKLVVSKLRAVLANEGLEEVELEGKEYDPNLAEVVSTEPGPKENVVTKVLQKAYRIKDKIVRPGKVIVSINSKN